MRLLVRAGAAQDPEGKARRRRARRRSCSTRARRRDSAQQIADQIDFDRRRARHRLGHGSDLRQRRRDEGLVRARRWTCWPTSSATRRLRRRRSSARSEQAMSSLQVSGEDPDYVASIALRSAGLRVPSVRAAGQRHAARRWPRITRDDLRAFHRQYFVPNNMILGDRRRHHRATRRSPWPSGCSAAGRAARCRRWKPVEPPPPTRRLVDRGQAGRGADRDSRRPARDSAQAPGLPGLGPGGEDPRRRRRQPAAPRAAVRARADLRRRGRHAGA